MSVEEASYQLGEATITAVIIHEIPSYWFKWRDRLILEVQADVLLRHLGDQADDDDDMADEHICPEELRDELKDIRRKLAAELTASAAEA